MWYYYYIEFGPGHQSFEDGYEFIDPNLGLGFALSDQHQLNDYFAHKAGCFDTECIVRYWPVDHLTEGKKSEYSELVNQQIKRLVAHRQRLQDMPAITDVIDETGYCKELASLLRKRETYRVIQALLANGLGVTAEQVRAWSLTAVPIESFYYRVFETIKAVEECKTK